METLTWLPVYNADLSQIDGYSEKDFNKVIQDNFPRTVYSKLGTFSNGESVYRLAEVL